MNLASGKFVASALKVVKAPLCDSCMYRSKVSGSLCLAYPAGIPMAIILGEVDHTKPYEGDHGLQFKAKKG